MAEPQIRLSDKCWSRLCSDCRAETCTHDCHDGMEYQFPYGWQVREGYDQRSSGGG